MIHSLKPAHQRQTQLPSGASGFLDPTYSLQQSEEGSHRHIIHSGPNTTHGLEQCGASPRLRIVLETKLEATSAQTAHPSTTPLLATAWPIAKLSALSSDELSNTPQCHRGRPPSPQRGEVCAFWRHVRWGRPAMSPQSLRATFAPSQRDSSENGLMKPLLCHPTAEMRRD